MDMTTGKMNNKLTVKGGDLTPQVGRFKTKDLGFVSLFGFLAAKVR